MARMAPSFFSRDGTKYVRGLSYLPVRRHMWEIQNLEIPQDRLLILPIAWYAQTTPTAIESGSDAFRNLDSTVIPYYNSGACEENSRINGFKFDFMIRPKEETDAAILELATMRMLTSFHDLKSGEVPYFKEKGGSGSDKRRIQFNTTTQAQKGRTAQYRDTLTFGDLPNTTTSILTVDDFSELMYMASIDYKHWVRGFAKTYLEGGAAQIYRGFEYFPAKVKRIQPGAFYALCFANLTKYNTAVPMVLDGTFQFDEMPLIDPSIYDA